jgi:hypothetical protein
MLRLEFTYHTSCGYQLTSMASLDAKNTSCIYLTLCISLRHMTTIKSSKHLQPLYHQCIIQKTSRNHKIITPSHLHFSSIGLQLLSTPHALGSWSPQGPAPAHFCPPRTATIQCCKKEISLKMIAQEKETNKLLKTKSFLFSQRDHHMTPNRTHIALILLAHSFDRKFSMKSCTL